MIKDSSAPQLAVGRCFQDGRKGILSHVETRTRAGVCELVHLRYGMEEVPRGASPTPEALPFLMAKHPVSVNRGQEP